MKGRYSFFYVVNQNFVANYFQSSHSKIKQAFTKSAKGILNQRIALDRDQNKEMSLKHYKIFFRKVQFICCLTMG